MKNQNSNYQINLPNIKNKGPRQMNNDYARRQPNPNNLSPLGGQPNGGIGGPAVQSLNQGISGHGYGGPSSNQLSNLPYR